MDVLAYLKDLNPQVRDKLLPIAGRIPALTLSRSRLIRMAKGEELVRMQDPFDRVFVLCKGSLRTVTHDLSGNDFLIDQFVAPAVFGEMELLLESKHYLGTLLATERSEVIAIDASDYKDWILTDPEMLFERSKWLVTKLAQQSRFERTMLSMYGTERVMYAIYLMCEPLPKDERASIRISQREIAERVKMSTKTVARALDELQDRRLIRTQGRKIVVEPEMRVLLDRTIKEVLETDQY